MSFLCAMSYSFCYYYPLRTGSKRNTWMPHGELNKPGCDAWTSICHVKRIFPLVLFSCYFISIPHQERIAFLFSYCHQLRRDWFFSRLFQRYWAGEWHFVIPCRYESAIWDVPVYRIIKFCRTYLWINICEVLKVLGARSKTVLWRWLGSIPGLI